jgi:diadenosine tetraphosphate (Ap4A) HIT family hydrolase
MSGCPFCPTNESNRLISNNYCYAIFDRYPVSDGHILIIPHRHVSSYFDTTGDEKDAIRNTIELCKQLLDQQYRPDGYNIGINIGEPAGQTVMHCHVHLIPRYVGDLNDPRGGVRGVIPKKRIYTHKTNSI